jgi:hypothetical protein
MMKNWPGEKEMLTCSPPSAGPHQRQQENRNIINNGYIIKTETATRNKANINIILTSGCAIFNMKVHYVIKWRRCKLESAKWRHSSK